VQPNFKIPSYTITEEEFSQLSRLIYQKIGIFLPPTKMPLMTVRLQKILTSLGLASFSEYYNYLLNDKSGQALSLLATKISTNYTYFYREEAHFQYFKDEVLPFLAQKQKQKGELRLRIWTAGCSTGEEPYMLAMLLKEYFGAEYPRWDAGVLATDISADVLEIAQQAIYPKDSIERVPPQIRHKYFTKYDDESVQIIDEIRKDVTLRRYNLMNLNPPFKLPFQVIFCRNVMIYFDPPTRSGLISRFVNLLEPGGYLFIGHSESIDRNITGIKPLIPAVYQKV
jgi:chemotaxis protein methyltransferase CheR